MTMIGPAFIALVLIASPVPDAPKQPQVTLYGATKTATFQVHEGSADDEKSSAGICFQMEGETDSHCFEARDGQERYFESPEIKFFSFPMNSPNEIGIFSAKQNYGGSGTALWLAALVFDPGSSSIRNLLPSVVLSRQGDYLVWSDRAASSFPLITVADITDGPDMTVEGEHKYRVQTFSYDPSGGRYRMIDSYKTRRAYNVFGSPTPVSVFTKEKPVLKARVDRAIHRHGADGPP